MASSQVKIHRIIEGPFSGFDVDSPLDEVCEEDYYFFLALVEIDGELSEEEVFFEDFNYFYEIKAHMDRSIEPYVIDVEWVEGYDG